ncbi:hypothetical protein A1QE_12590 [Vibrio breoganii ZF-55]|nr:hypothetical protein A1QE_12590 [Vibrio breoganii ZF-55]
MSLCFDEIDFLYSPFTAIIFTNCLFGLTSVPILFVVVGMSNNITGQAIEHSVVQQAQLKWPH